MIEKVNAGIKLLAAGYEVLDPGKWRGRQMTANKIVAFLATLIVFARLNGYEVPVISDEVLESLGMVLVTFGNWVGTVITTKKLGLFGKVEE